MHRERGYEHIWDTGNVVLTNFGIGLITGLRIRRNPTAVIYYVTLEETREEKVIFETEILGTVTHKWDHAPRQIETLPGL